MPNGFQKHQTVPVNIKENEESFELFLFAPSLNKENFSITTKDDLLVISYQAREEENKDEDFTRKEYHFKSFERSFYLNGKVDCQKIHAVYREGVLIVTLPKDPAQNKPKQQVPIV
ncbi:MAG: hypothetical protein NVS9B7_13220 [Flavisolibacter sp.]